MWKTVIWCYLHLFKKNKRYESNQKINANKKLAQAAYKNWTKYIFLFRILIYTLNIF